MSDKPAIIAGTYTGVAFLNKIGVARVTIEIPRDIWDANRDALGDPPPFDGAKKFVAVSRITEEAFKTWAGPCGPSQETPSEPVAKPANETASAVEPRKYTRSQIAALKIRDPEFQAWIMRHCFDELGHNYVGGDAVEEADANLKAVLAIVSKSDLDKWPEAGAKWDALLTTYDTRNMVRA